MVETIESFVEKLHAQGVEAGKQAAETIRRQAQAEAERIVAEARGQAERIVAQAQAQARQSAERQRGELDLAARDTVLRFRQAIGQAVTSLLTHEVDKVLDDKEFLAKLIHDTVVNYAHEDSRRGGSVEVNVNKDALTALTNWALKYLADGAAGRQPHAHVDLKGTLKSHGFEYRLRAATVEVTVESIVGLLKEQMAPNLRQVLDRALAGAKS